MQKARLQLPTLTLAGVTVRTNNRDEFRPEMAKISPCVQRYFHNALFNLLPHRKNPGRTFCAYTEYESDETGMYTFLIGEEVERRDQCPDGITFLEIPAQEYVRWTTEPGPMPDVVKNAWKSIWAMSPAQIGGKRRYQTDFELYDERARDHGNVVLDIYIGIDPIERK